MRLYLLEPNLDGTGGGGSSAGDLDPSGGGTQTPAGFVPQADFEKAETQRRGFQAERDRLAAEIAALKATPPAGTPASGGDDGTNAFDPEAFKSQILSAVHGATAIQTEATTLRAEFPHAEAGLFTPDSLAGFTSVAALRLAAMDSHTRVADAIKAAVDAREAELRAEFAGQDPGTGDPPPGGTTAAGDPTPEQLNAMTFAELNELEEARPGVIDRVLRSAPQ